MGAKRPKESLFADAYQLSAPHSFHVTGEVWHVQMYFRRERLHQSGGNIRAHREPRPKKVLKKQYT